MMTDASEVETVELDIPDTPEEGSNNNNSSKEHPEDDSSSSSDKPGRGQEGDVDNSDADDYEEIIDKMNTPGVRFHLTRPSFRSAEDEEAEVITFPPQLTGDWSPVNDGIYGTTPTGSELNLEVLTTQERTDSTRHEENEMMVKVAKYFDEVASKDNTVSKRDFQKALGYKNTYMADRFFAAFDKEQAGRVDKTILLSGLSDLAGNSVDHKLKFLFGMIDEDGSGCLEPDELSNLLFSCMKESSLKLSLGDVDELTLALLESAGKDEQGAMTFDELSQLLKSHPLVLDNLTFSMARWLMPDTPKNSTKTRPSVFSKQYIQNNANYVVFMICYFLINLGLFTLSAVRYRSFNWCVIIARGCGMCLNFNSAFVLVPMLRHSLTWLRKTPVARILPLDDSIDIHKMVGKVIAVQGLIHTLAHLGNLGYVVSDETPVNGTQPLKYWEYLFTLKSQVGYVGPGFAFLSGVMLVVILVLIVVFSCSCVRRSGHFQVFYWSHKLYLVFWIFCILHGPIFWIFFLGPCLVFFMEVIIFNPLTRVVAYGRTYITKVHLLPSKVTNLEITRPGGFHYQPGDYIFINIPCIAPFEWHPFTISSAPESPDTIGLHIRSLGNWTNSLYAYFESQAADIPTIVSDTTQKPSRKSEKSKSKKSSQRAVNRNRWLTRLKSSRRKPMECKVSILIDGPYGTPTRAIFDTEHAVLIGAGIGVTPFASILQSVMYRFKASKHDCPRCALSWYGVIPDSVMKLRKMDFIWVNRDQKSFEWFVGLLAKLEVEQAEEGSFGNFLEMQMYMTSAISNNDLRGVGLQLALELIHQKKHKDLVTGLRTRTHPGRPEWDKVFRRIDSRKKGKVKVFFCGASVMGKILEEKCKKYNFEFSKESF